MAELSYLWYLQVCTDFKVIEYIWATEAPFFVSISEMLQRVIV